MGKIHKLLFSIKKVSDYYGHEIEIYDGINSYMCRCYSKNIIEFNVIINFLIDNSYISRGSESGLYFLTIKGHEFLAETNIESKQIFVAMKFDLTMITMIGNIKDSIKLNTGFDLFLISDRCIRRSY